MGRALTRLGHRSVFCADILPYGSDGLIDQCLQLVACQIRVELFYLSRRLGQNLLLYSMV